MREIRTEAATAARALVVPTALFIASAIISVSGCGGEPGPPPEVIAAGKGHFMTTCATCHGKDAMGLPRLGKRLVDNEWVQDHSDEEFLELIKSGRSATHPLNTTGVDMPPKGGNPALSDEDMKAIIAYVRTLQ